MGRCMNDPESGRFIRLARSRGLVPAFPSLGKCGSGQRPPAVVGSSPLRCWKDPEKSCRGVPLQPKGHTAQVRMAEGQGSPSPGPGVAVGAPTTDG